MIVTNSLFPVFINQTKPVTVNAPLTHLIDDMPVHSDRDLIEFSYNAEHDNLINFSNTANAAEDLFRDLDLSESFSWLFGSMDQIDIDNIAAAMHITNMGYNSNDDAAETTVDFDDMHDSLLPLSPLNHSPTDWSYECKRVIADLDQCIRKLNFS